MGLLSTEVEVGIGNNLSYYKSLGYIIPKYYNQNNGRHMVKKGTKIFVKVSDLPSGSHAEVNIQCDSCHQQYNMPYKTYLHFLHQNGHIYCHKCACKLFNGGQNHYKWSDNKTDEERILGRHSLEYTNFIKLVLKRDDYTCQCCGSVHGDLKVHHLDGYNWCVEKRTDITNGITLCEECHNNFHSLYGYGNNTKEQFEEWFGEALSQQAYNGTLQSMRQVYCIEENKIYYSVNDLAKRWHMKGTAQIYNVCNHATTSYNSTTHDGQTKVRYVQNYTIKGKHVMWYSEYINMTSDEVETYISTNKYHPYTKKVVCVTTNQVFDSIKLAKNCYGANGISACCKGKIKSSGRLDDGTPLVWKYYDDYFKEDI